MMVLCGMFWALGASAQSPAIFFSDLDSGPNTGGANNKGAFVTIYGKGFGATQGSSSVSVGGGLVDNYPVWSDTKVAFQLGAAAQTGNIVIKVNGASSNGVSFTVRGGNIYFVSPSGNDASTGSFTAPWRDPVQGKNKMAAGDITYLRAGSYTGEDNWGAILSLNGVSGTQGNPKAMVGYPGENAKLDGTNPACYNGANCPFVVRVNLGTAAQYWTFANLEFAGGGSQTIMWDVSGGGSGLRFVGNSIHAPGGNNSCVAMQGPLTDNKWYGNHIYDCDSCPESSTKAYDLYYGGYGVQDTIDIGWNVMNNNCTQPNLSKGIQFYGHVSGDIFRHLKIHDNLIYGHCMEGMVIGGSDGPNDTFENTDTEYIYNNVLVHNGYCAPNFGYSALKIASVNSPVGNFKVYNNTFYFNGANPQPSASGDLDNQGVKSIEVDNNIFVAPIPNGSYCGYVCYEYTGTASQMSGHNNLFLNFGNGPSWATNSINNTNPQFVNAATSGNFDFHLQASSLAVDAGMAIATVGTDFDGVPRPQGAAFDLGAYERFSGGTTSRPNPPTNLKALPH